VWRHVCRTSLNLPVAGLSGSTHRDRSRILRPKSGERSGDKSGGKSNSTCWDKNSRFWRYESHYYRKSASLAACLAAFLATFAGGLDVILRVCGGGSGGLNRFRASSLVIVFAQNTI
jgi:hypothetical protein